MFTAVHGGVEQTQTPSAFFSTSPQTRQPRQPAKCAHSSPPARTATHAHPPTPACPHDGASHLHRNKTQFLKEAGRERGDGRVPQEQQRGPAWGKEAQSPPSHPKKFKKNMGKMGGRLSGCHPLPPHPTRCRPPCTHLLGPRALHHRGRHGLLVALHALGVRTVLEAASNLPPVVGAQPSHCVSQNPILREKHKTTKPARQEGKKKSGGRQLDDSIAPPTPASCALLRKEKEFQHGGAVSDALSGEPGALPGISSQAPQTLARSFLGGSATPATPVHPSPPPWST